MSHDALEPSLIPFVLTVGSNREHLNLDLDLGDKRLAVLLVEDASNAEFCQILNRGNQLAFGGPTDMGMPLWVMLDCAILPSAMVGFALPRQRTPQAVLDQLEVDDDYEGLVPISEYCACPTIGERTVCGFSLHSHIPGRGIATRTKALGLCIYGARHQIGVTQFTNPSIRVHVRFGPLEITVHRPTVHTHAEDSFVYRLALPSQAKMLEMVRGEDEFGAGERPTGQRWLFDPDDELSHGRLREHLAAGGRAWVIPPGWRAAEEGHEVSMILGE